MSSLLKTNTNSHNCCVSKMPYSPKVFLPSFFLFVSLFEKTTCISFHPPVTNQVWCSRKLSWFSAVEICIFPRRRSRRGNVHFFYRAFCNQCSYLELVPFPTEKKTLKPTMIPIKPENT